MSEVAQEGIEAVTEYTVEARYEDPQRVQNKFCLLSVKPLTGRTHQIRVHMASLGLPLVRDEQYGNKRVDTPWCQRIFLHCYTLDLQGLDGETVHLKADLTQELQLTLSQLQFLEGNPAMQVESKNAVYVDVVCKGKVKLCKLVDVL